MEAKGVSGPGGFLDRWIPVRSFDFHISVAKIIADHT